MTQIDIKDEFKRQVNNLFQKGYPEFMGQTEAIFIKSFERLESRLFKEKLSDIDINGGKLPFVIVVNNNLVSTGNMMEKINKDGKTGVVNLNPLNPEDFSTIGTELIPKDELYLLLDIDRGKESLNVRPVDAMKQILQSGRHPLTINEGVAIVTHFPEFLMKNNCFSLLASRHSGDKRVPAIWLDAKKHPKLGWCWDGNPHTWLGSASCSNRVS